VRARAQTLISMCPRGQRGQPPPPPYGHPWTMAEPPPLPSKVSTWNMDAPLAAHMPVQNNNYYYFVTLIPYMFFFGIVLLLFKATLILTLTYLFADTLQNQVIILCFLVSRALF